MTWYSERIDGDDHSPRAINLANVLSVEVIQLDFGATLRFTMIDGERSDSYPYKDGEKAAADLERLVSGKAVSRVAVLS